MEVPDIIGFIVSLIAVLFLIGRNIFKQRRRQQHPEEVEMEERKQKDALKDFLRSLEVDMDAIDEEEKEERNRPVVRPQPPPPPPPVVVKAKSHRRVEDEFQFQTKVEQRRLQTAVEERKLQTSIEKRKTDFGANLVSLDLRHRKDAYHHKTVEQKSRAEELISRLGSKKEMVILQELLNSPRSIQAYRDRF